MSELIIKNLAKSLYSIEVPDNTDELQLWWSVVINKSFEKMNLQLLADFSHREQKYSVGHCRGMTMAWAAGSQKVSTGVFIQNLMRIEHHLLPDNRIYPLLGQYILKSKNDFPKLIEFTDRILNLSEENKEIIDEMEIDEEIIEETIDQKNKEINQEEQKRITSLGRWAWSIHSRFIQAPLTLKK